MMAQSIARGRDPVDWSWMSPRVLVSRRTPDESRCLVGIRGSFFGRRRPCSQNLNRISRKLSIYIYIYKYIYMQQKRTRGKLRKRGMVLGLRRKDSTLRPWLWRLLVQFVRKGKTCLTLLQTVSQNVVVCLLAKWHSESIRNFRVVLCVTMHTPCWSTFHHMSSAFALFC